MPWETYFTGEPQLRFDECTAGQLFDSAPAFVALVSAADYRFIYVNSAYERLVQRTGLVGQTVAEALPEVVPQGFLDLLCEAVETKEAVSGHDVPLLLKRADIGSRRRYIAFVYQPIVDAGNCVSSIFCFGYDSTADHEMRRLGRGLAAAMRELDFGDQPERPSMTADVVKVLSIRERELLQLLVRGKSNKAMAREMGLSPRTVEMYRGRMYQKLGAGSAAEAIRLGIESGLS